MDNALNSKNMKSKQSIADFYIGKSVFITGVTGFLGKGLLEKLLYSCTGIDKIYVLIRNKKGDQAEERLKKTLNSIAFDRLRERGADIFKKVIPISGTISEENLGISNDDLETLKQHVSVVFHLAASINFHEPLKTALASNVNGTIETIKLCHSIKNLQAFIHVSTAFSNADRKYVEEIVYPNDVELHHVRSVSELFSNDEHVIKTLIGKKPNTYTYTKALAEEIVMRENHNLPISIIRPTIVICSQKEPIPGWVDNWNGATGIFVGMSSGVMKVMTGKGSNVTDLVPLDIVTNLTIVAATKCERSSLKVYNCCTGKSNPITCGKAEVYTRKATYKHSINKLPFPFLLFISSTILYNLMKFLLQVLPAYLIDLWLLFIGKKPIQMKIQHKISNTVEVMKYFLINVWHFEDGNVRKLLDSLSERDKEEFNFDVKSINWDNCVENYVLGATKYLLQTTSNKLKK